MSTENQEPAYDSHKHVAVVYDYKGQIAEANGDENENRLRVWAFGRLSTEQNQAGLMGHSRLIPILDTYTRDRDVRKLVEEAYAKGVADGKAGVQ